MSKKANKHNRSRKTNGSKRNYCDNSGKTTKPSTGDCINPADYSLKQLANMPTYVLVEMLLNHENGKYADFAFVFSAMREAYEISELCHKQLCSNNGCMDELILKSAKQAKEKLEHAIELLPVIFANHRELGYQQQLCIKLALLDSQNELFVTFNFDFN